MAKNSGPSWTTTSRLLRRWKTTEMSLGDDIITRNCYNEPGGGVGGEEEEEEAKDEENS